MYRKNAMGVALRQEGNVYRRECDRRSPSVRRAMFIWKERGGRCPFLMIPKSPQRFRPSSTDMALLTEGGPPSPTFYRHGPPDGGHGPPDGGQDPT